MRLLHGLVLTTLGLGCAHSTESAERAAPTAPLSVPEPVEGPFSCLETSRESKLTVRVTVAGCFDGSETTVRMATRDGVAGTVRVETDSHSRALLFKDLQIDASERLWLLRSVAQAAVRQEAHSGCASVTKVSSRIEWRCADADADFLLFETSECDDRALEHLEKAAGERAGARSKEAFAELRERVRNAYAPAHGVARVIGDFLARKGCAPLAWNTEMACGHSWPPTENR